MRLGVRVLHGRPRHPQTQGKEERFHRTFKAEVVNGFGFRDLAECQRAFDDWRPRYNHERPHDALDLATPGERYRPSSRSFPKGPAGDRIRARRSGAQGRRRRLHQLQEPPLAHQQGFAGRADRPSPERRGRRVRRALLRSPDSATLDLRQADGGTWWVCWTTLRVAHRVHRANNSSSRSLRNEEVSTMSPNTRHTLTNRHKHRPNTRGAGVRAPVHPTRSAEGPVELALMVQHDRKTR